MQRRRGASAGATDTFAPGIVVALLVRMLGSRALHALAVGSLATALFGAGCTPEIASSEQEIVNGQVSTQGAHPATVYLWLGNGSCSGTLITPRVVLTARHCVEGTTTEYLEVFFGNDTSGDGTWVNVEDIAYHSTGDLGILTMVQPGPATPVPVSSRPLTNTNIGMSVLLVGFGDTGSSGGAGIKREGETTLEDLDSDIMYVGSTGSKTCYGDSGGPTFVDWNGVKHVVGVASFITNEDCTLGQSGNVRTDMYYDWISDYVDAHDPAGCHQDGRCGSMCTSVDPDCPCAADGFCTDQCADYVNDDPDCAQCGTGDGCQTNCPALDTDCCVMDEVCDAACGDLDPDCLPPGDDPPDDPPADLGDDPPMMSGGCSSGGHTGGAFAFVLLLLAALRVAASRVRATAARSARRNLRSR